MKHAQYDPQRINALADELMNPQRLADGGPPSRSKLGRATAAIQGARSIGDEPLPGAPTKANVTNVGEVRLGRNLEAEEAARRASEMTGVPYRPTTRYAPVDVDRATRIAREYELMKHDPDDPLVKMAYEQMIKETSDQYEAMLQAGIEPYFIEPGNDPYRNSPYEALLDVAENRRLGVFPSVEGFGTDPNFNPQGNPMLQETGRLISGRPALANDLFRAVHDYFGHAKPGVGFRAAGEENAYQSHAGMFSPLARRALASETRGQNSWLNYGPYGETNRTARIEDTRFADQKAGLMPRWASEAGLVINDDRRREFFDNLARNQTGLEGAISDDGKLRLVHYSSRPLERIDPEFYGRGLSRASRAERNRSYDPEFLKRSYYGIPASEKPYLPEFGLGGIRNEVLIEPELIYQAQANPEGLWLPNDPTGSERRIAEAGYTGYYSTDPKLGKVAVIFDPYDVSKSYMIPVGAVGAGAMALSGEEEPEGFAGGGAIRKAAEAIRAVGREPDLDMSTEARMQRAQELEFDTSRPLYHSTNASFDAFEVPEGKFLKFGKGVYTAPSAKYSDRYIRKNRDIESGYKEGANVMPLYARGKIANEKDWEAARQEMMSEGVAPAGYNPQQEEIQRRLKEKGFDGLNMFGNEIIIFDPKNLRSVNAAFDPENRGSADLLAGTAGAALLGGAAMDDEPEGFAEGGRVEALSDMARRYMGNISEAGNVYKAAVGNMFSPFEPVEPQLGDPNDYEFPELRLRRPGIVNLALGMPNMAADLKDLFGAVKDVATGDEVPDESWRRFDIASEAQDRYENDMDTWLRNYTGKSVDELSAPMSAVLGVSEALAQPGIISARAVQNLPRVARYLSNLAEFATPVTVASPGAMLTGAGVNAGFRSLPALLAGDDLEQMSDRYSGRELSAEEQARLQDYVQQLIASNNEKKPVKLAEGGLVYDADRINALANELMNPVKLADGGPPGRSRVGRAAAAIRAAGSPTDDVAAIDSASGTVNLPAQITEPVETSNESFRLYHGTPHVFGPSQRVRNRVTGKEYVSDPKMVESVMAMMPDQYEVIGENPLGMFDINRIGSGEGAQAYGFGAYGTQVPDVGRGYRQTLLRRHDIPDTPQIGGQAIEDVYSQIERRAARLPIEQARKEYDKLAIIEQMIIDGDILGVKQGKADYDQEAYNWFEQSIAPKYTRPGALYEMQVNAPQSMFLDWDKPIADQTPEVQASLQAAGIYDPDIEYRIALLQNEKQIIALDRDPVTNAMRDERRWHDLSSEIEQLRKKQPANMTGRQAYFLSAADATSQAEASEALKGAGIPGIQYLDQASRGDGDGTRNFVIFDPKMIEILEKYGLAGATTGAAVLGGAAMQDEPEEMAEGGTPRSKVGRAAAAVRGLTEDAGRVADDVSAQGTVRLPDEIIQSPAQRRGGYGRSTIRGAGRKTIPGIYDDPREIVERASRAVAPESEAMQQLFGVTREDLADIAMSRAPTNYLPPGAPARPRGTDYAELVMQPANTNRLVDILGESLDSPLRPGMTGWYIFDPVYNRLKELVGEDEAQKMFLDLNTLTGVHSANAAVANELTRGSAMNWLNREGRLDDYLRFGGKAGLPGSPIDMATIPGHMAHKTAHVVPALRYLETGELSREAKTPAYIASSTPPELGTNINFPVGDAHFVRGIGLSDVRPETKDPTSRFASWSMPEAMQLSDWFARDVARRAGLPGVPGQALLWGALSPTTGVKSKIGAPKLEILSDLIMQTANRLRITPEEARDMVLTGKAYAGKAEGGLAKYSEMMRGV